MLYDLRCEPRDKEEETRLLAQHLMEADAKSGIKVISRNKASAITNPGAALSSNWGNNFIARLPLFLHFSRKLTVRVNRKALLRPNPRRARPSRMPVFPRTFFWICSSSASASISTGR